MAETLYQILQKARSEEDVKDAYIIEIHPTEISKAEVYAHLCIL